MPIARGAHMQRQRKLVKQEIRRQAAIIRRALAGEDPEKPPDKIA